MHLQGRLLCIIYILYISIFMFQCWGITGTPEYRFRSLTSQCRFGSWWSDVKNGRKVIPVLHTIHPFKITDQRPMRICHT